MRAVVLMFDSLNRHFLSPYGATWTRTPNFRRLAQRAVTFDRSYVASMPCMPARRDLHTGRPGFLRRHWGPLEPWDFSCIEAIGKSGVHTHLATDHYHYFEDGGANYHCRYDTWEFFRGQEGDPWVGQVADPIVPKNENPKGRKQDWINREAMRRDADHCQTKTVDAGLDFIDRNAADDRWLLQIECFDPHEPYFCSREWKDLFPHPDDDETLYDWPTYQLDSAPRRELVEQARRRYAALLAKCDASLGHVLDRFDEHGLWDDTMLVVWTDHGMLLGEHGQMLKNVMPLYEEVSHTPLFVHDPRHGARGERRASIVQPAIDLCPTLLNYFGCDVPETVIGKDLSPVVQRDENGRDAALFGYFGQRVNVVTDRHAYYRGGDDSTPNVTYTMEPARMRWRWDTASLRDATLADAPLPDSRGVRPLAIPGGVTGDKYRSSLLFDLKADPAQQRPLDDADLTSRLASRMRELMVEADAPPEQLARVGLAG